MKHLLLGGHHLFGSALRVCLLVWNCPAFILLTTPVAQHPSLSFPVDSISLLCDQLCLPLSPLCTIGSCRPQPVLTFVFLGPQQALNNGLSSRVGFQSQDFSFQHKSHISSHYFFFNILSLKDSKLQQGMFISVAN